MNYSYMQENGILTDVILRSVEGRDFQAHKVLLANKSQYFFRLFTGPFNKDVVADNVSSRTLEMYLDKVYERSVNISHIWEDMVEYFKYMNFTDTEWRNKTFDIRRSFKHSDSTQYLNDVLEIYNGEMPNFLIGHISQFPVEQWVGLSPEVISLLLNYTKHNLSDKSFLNNVKHLVQSGYDLNEIGGPEIMLTRSVRELERNPIFLYINQDDDATMYGGGFVYVNKRVGKPGDFVTITKYTLDFPPRSAPIITPIEWHPFTIDDLL